VSEEEESYALVALTGWVRWTDRHGALHRHAGPRASEAFDYHIAGSDVWVPTEGPGLRPWTRVVSKPAPATLAECVSAVGERAVTRKRYRREAWADGPGSHGAFGEGTVLIGNAIASDWVYSVDGGDTWISPNGVEE
jgi:hypothetical protein